MRVLIVKLGAIGDVLMAMPMVTRLREDHPGVRITWLCGAAAAPLVRLIDDIEVIVIDDARLIRRGPMYAAVEVARAWMTLFGRRFELVITGYSHPLYRLLTLTTRAARRVSFHRGRRRWTPVPGRHHSDEYCRLAGATDGPSIVADTSESLGVAMPPLDLPPPSDPRPASASPDRGLIAIVPGGAGSAKPGSAALRRWPLESYVAIARALIRRGFTVAITGDAADKWVRPAFAALPIIDLIDATSLIDLLALYRGCAAVVAHDCGPMHLAIAAGTPTVAIFGPTMPAEKVRPSAAAAVIWGGGHLACRPCYDGRTYAPCADNQCLKTVGISEVMAALDGVIAAAHPLAAERPETLGQRRSAGASR